MTATCNAQQRTSKISQKRLTKNIKNTLKKFFFNSPAGRMHKHHLVHHQCLQNNIDT